MKPEKEHFFDAIPEYHQNSLDADQRLEFEQELAQNDELQQELDDFRRFEKMYQEIEGDVPDPSPALFEKIVMEIERGEAEEKSGIAQVQNEESFTDKLHDIVSWLKESVTLPWGLAVVQAVALVILLMPASNTQQYETLSNTPSLSSVVSGEKFNIVFNPATTESEIRAILLSAKATIISGPSQQGKYVIVLPSESNVTQAADTLKTHNRVMFVEKAY